MSRPKRGKKYLKPITHEDVYSHGIMECPLCKHELPAFRLYMLMQRANNEKRSLSYFKDEQCPICQNK